MYGYTTPLAKLVNVRLYHTTCQTCKVVQLVCNLINLKQLISVNKRKDKSVGFKAWVFFNP